MKSTAILEHLTPGPLDCEGVRFSALKFCMFCDFSPVSVVFYVHCFAKSLLETLSASVCCEETRSCSLFTLLHRLLMTNSVTVPDHPDHVWSVFQNVL